MASPIFRINGGAPGAKASVAASGAVSATLDSIDGVGSVEWFIDSTDETTDPNDYVLVQSGSVGQTVSTTALTAGTAAILRARINGGTNRATEQPDPTGTNATAKFFVPTALGREVGVAGEEFESDATYGSTGIVNAAVRETGGVSFADVQAALAAATSAVAFNGQALTEVSGVKFRNDADTQDIDAITKDAGDIVRVGEDTDALGVRLSTAALGFIGLNYVSEHFRFTASGLAIQVAAAANVSCAAVGAGNGTSITFSAGNVTAGAGTGGSVAFFAGKNTGGAGNPGNAVLVLPVGPGGTTGTFKLFDENDTFADIDATATTTSIRSSDRATLDVEATTTLLLTAGGQSFYTQTSAGISLSGLLTFNGADGRQRYRYTTLADADQTIDVDFDNYRFAAPGANRAITVRVATAPIPVSGERIKVARPAAGAFTITLFNEGDLVNAIVTLTASNFATAEIVFNGTLWELAEFSTNATPGPSA